VSDHIALMARDFSLWLNSTYPEGLCEEAVFWRRVGKISEEAGEVREASGAYWQENPRKPAGPVDDVIKELADCVGAALGAIEHLTGHRGRSLDIATERVRYVCDRVGVQPARCGAEQNTANLPANNPPHVCVDKDPDHWPRTKHHDYQVPPFEWDQPEPRHTWGPP
jgi:hypothetical protein